MPIGRQVHEQIVKIKIRLLEPSDQVIRVQSVYNVCVSLQCLLSVLTFKTHDHLIDLLFFLIITKHLHVVPIFWILKVNTSEVNKVP